MNFKMPQKFMFGQDFSRLIEFLGNFCRSCIIKDSTARRCRRKQNVKFLLPSHLQLYSLEILGIVPKSDKVSVYLSNLFIYSLSYQNCKTTPATNDRFEKLC